MDYIREALDKANVSLDKSAPAIGAAGLATRPASATRPVSPEAIPAGAAWSPPQVQLDTRHLERRRVVAGAMADPAHVTFNLLRTRILAVMQSNKWKTLGVTSSAPGSGKTMVAVNLAISLARGENLKTVLLDLDLKRPAVSPTLGVKSNASLGAFLRGEASAEDCFVQVRPGLVVGLGGGHLRQSSELLQGPRATELLEFVTRTLAPDIIVFDLPPMAVSDDVIAFMPHMDTTLLVAAAGQTTVAQIDSCEQQISQHGNFLGVVLNKAEIETRDYYY